MSARAQALFDRIGQGCEDRRWILPSIIYFHIRFLYKVSGSLPTGRKPVEYSRRRSDCGCRHVATGKFGVTSSRASQRRHCHPAAQQQERHSLSREMQPPPSWSCPPTQSPEAPSPLSPHPTTTSLQDTAHTESISCSFQPRDPAAYPRLYSISIRLLRHSRETIRRINWFWNFSNFLTS